MAHGETSASRPARTGAAHTAGTVAGAGIVLTMLADADAVVTAMERDDGALPVMADTGEAEDPIWLQMSTIGETATEWCIGLAGRYGVGFVDAPVLGTRQPAEGLGIDPALFFQAIEDGPLDLPYLRAKARAIAERDFGPSFRLRLAAKDAGLVADAASIIPAKLPGLSSCV
jgi:3-hydroxyisobutyrate dehydrogenase-like beta-hydroxyacid dehydrogenase